MSSAVAVTLLAGVVLVELHGPPAGASYRGEEGRFAVVSSDEDFVHSIAAVDTDGSHFAALTGGSLDAYPTWSPDGTRLAFSRLTEGGTDEPAQHIWTMDATGGSLREITTEPDRYDNSPTWSPDGSQIAFVGAVPRDDDDGIERQIWVMNFDGSDVRQVTTGDDHDNPKWSPEGSKIAFTTVEPFAGNDMLGVMNPDGTEVAMLADDADYGSSRDFDWSPDGSRIVFGGTDGTEAGLWVIQARPGAPRTKLPTLGLDGYPAWSPDGSRIAFISSDETQRVRVAALAVDDIDAGAGVGDIEILFDLPSNLRGYSQLDWQALDGQPAPPTSIEPTTTTTTARPVVITKPRFTG